jgi:hypothetical protein
MDAMTFVDIHILVPVFYTPDSMTLVIRIGSCGIGLQDGAPVAGGTAKIFFH